MFARRMTVATRLIIGFGGLLLVTIVVAGVGGWGAWRSGTSTHAVLSRDARAALLAAEARAAVLELRRSEKDVFLNVGAPDQQASYARTWGEQAALLRASLRDLLPLVDPGERSRIESVQRDLEIYENGIPAGLGGGAGRGSRDATGSQQANWIVEGGHPQHRQRHGGACSCTQPHDGGGR